MFVLSLLLGATFTLSAQKINGAQIIRLKTGGTLLGTVIHQDTIHCQIVLLSGDTISLSDQSIAGIIDQKKEYTFFPNGKFTPTRGKYFSFLINTYFGYNEDDVWNPLQFDFSPITFSGGYRFNQQLEVGAGTGFDAYGNYGPFLPLFAEARYYINKNSTTLFVGGKLGHSFLINPNDIWFSDESSGGLLMNPIIGLKGATRRKSKFLFEAGIRVQHATFVRRNNTDKVTIYRYTIGAGWLF